MNDYFVFRIPKTDGIGYKYGIYNKDHDKWALNIVFKGSLKECEEEQKRLNNS